MHGIDDDATYFLMSSQTALKSQRKDTLYGQYLPKLGEVIPAFGAELSLYPDIEKVQQPLQKIFALYMDCYETMLSHIVSPQAGCKLPGRKGA